MKRRDYIRLTGVSVVGLAGCTESELTTNTQTTTSNSEALTAEQIRQDKLRTFLDALENDLKYPISVQTLVIVENEGLLGPDYIVKLEYITNQPNLELFQDEQVAIAMLYKVMVNFDNWDVGRLDIRTYESAADAERRKPAIAWQVETAWVEYYVEGSLSRDEFIERVILSVENVESTPEYEPSLPSADEKHDETTPTEESQTEIEENTPADTVTETPTVTEKPPDLPKVDWVRGYSDALIQSAIQTIDGGYLLAGFTRTSEQEDLGLLIKTNSKGILRWRKTFGGDQQDRLHSLVSSKDGGYALVGETMSSGPPQQNVWFVKVDTRGDILWEKTYGGDKADWGYSVMQENSGTFLILGTTGSFGSGGKDAWLVEVDQSGAEISNWTYGGQRSQTAQKLISTSDGRLAFAGWTLPDDPVSGNEGWLVKLNQDKTEMWSKNYGGAEDDYLRGMIRTSDGGFALAGTTRSGNSGGRNVWLVKADDSGEKEWSQNFGGDGQDRACSVKEIDNGGFIVSGQSMSSGPNARNPWLIRTDSEGNKIWDNYYGNRVGNSFPQIVQADENSYVLVGNSGLIRLLR